MNKTLRYTLFLIFTMAAINLVFTAIALFFGNFLFNSLIVRGVLLMIASLLASSVVAYLILSTSPLLHNYVQTFRRLLRLESLSHPLLVRFSHQAPGTYHHTLTVANIAARAAKIIGANSLLTRVGAYYHDIGKMESPEYFVENQKPEQNAHDKLSDPLKSARIIIGHVASGINLAKEYHLPNEITDLIQQHQGTTLVSFFYDQARSLGQKVKKSDFRYPGPKPLSREAAILMLADGVEAAVRAIPHPTYEDIKKAINEIITQRTEDGQLELSGLTSAQLTKIRQSFLESLSAIFHQRIKYPGNGADNDEPNHQPLAT